MVAKRGVSCVLCAAGNIKTQKHTHTAYVTLPLLIHIYGGAIKNNGLLLHLQCSLLNALLLLWKLA